MGKDFGYIYCNAVTNSTSLCCNGTYMRVGCAASGSWKNYHMTGHKLVFLVIIKL
jgi:hypothetical protein